MRWLGDPANGNTLRFPTLNSHSLKGAVGVAGQGFSESSATSGAGLSAGSRQAPLDTSLAHELDLQ